MAKKLNLVDMYGIGLMLEHLVAEGNITCEERDRVILRIARENDIAEYMLSNLAGYGRSKQEVLERAKRRKGLESQGKKQEEGYISLTEVARAHSEDAPGYVIQSWLRSGNTLAFLNLWEQENNPNYSETGYAELLKRKKTASFTLTPKLWIDQTKAIGIVSKQGKNGGMFAHPMIACEFASWIAPEFKMQLLKLSLDRTKLR
ncbi:MAG: KilA-N domain-containing protein [Oscillospiraceae bacterium]